MIKHILFRLGWILMVILIATLLFFVIWDKPSSAMGAALMSMLVGTALAIVLLIYLCVESISLFKNQKKMFGVINLFLGLILLLIILFILGKMGFSIF